MFQSDNNYSPSVDQKKQMKNEKEQSRRNIEKAMIDAIQKFLVLEDPDMLNTKMEKKDTLSKALQCLQNYKVQIQLMKAENTRLLAENQGLKVMNLYERMARGQLQQEICRLKEMYEGGGKEDERENNNPSPDPSDMSSLQFSSPDSDGSPPYKKNCSFSSFDSPLSSSSSTAFTPISRPVWKPWSD